MKIKTIRLKKSRELTPEQENITKNTIIITALFAAGMIIGSGIMKKGSTAEIFNDVASIFYIHINNRKNSSFSELFFNSCAVNIFFISTVFFTGLSCVGIPVAVFIPILKGIGFGMLSGFLFVEYTLNGIGYYLLTVFPPAIISISVLLLSSSASLLMSKNILATLFEKKQSDKTVVVKYIKNNLLYFLGTVISSVVEVLLIKAFSHLFIF